MSLLSMKRATTSVVNSLWLTNGNVQNGVLDNQPLYNFDSTTGATATIARVPSKLENGTEDRAQRPTELEIKVNNEIKNHIWENRILDKIPIDHASLPSSPASDSSPDCGALDQDTREVIVDLFRTYAGVCGSSWKPSKTQSTMKRVVESVIDKHQYAYNGMITKLSLDELGDDMSVISNVAESVFSDGTTNWGRIASLLAFGAAVSKHLKERGKGRCVDYVADEISSYLLAKQRDWLIKNNAWDGFVEFFHVEDTESSVRSMLMAIAGVAGLGAGIAFFIK